MTDPPSFHRRLGPSGNRGPCQNLSEAMGGVPTVRLHRISPLCATHEIYLKLESCNPAGSIKDKNAAFLVDEAERRGLLQPGGTIIESSSGNFGVALAMVGASRGYRVMVVVDAKTTQTFRRMLRAYGAELVEVEAVDGPRSMQTARMDRAIELALAIEGAWYPCQHFNPDNPEVHEVITAREIKETFGKRLDALVVGVSTGGQLSGLARHLKPVYPRLKLIGVDVVGSVIFDTPSSPYKMTGVGLSFRPPNLDYQSIDQAYVVPENLAYSVCRALASQEGLLLGASTGAIVAAGLHFARTLPAKSRIVMLNPDRGDRYLETIYDDEWLENNGFHLFSAEEIESAIEQLAPCHVPRNEP